MCRTVRALLCALSLLLLALCTVACAPADDFDAGKPITKEDLASISAELFASTVVTPDSDGADRTDYPSGTVHWTEGGNVYHADPNCYHLKRAKEVLHGTVKKAIQSGKEKPCSVCGGD